MRARYALFAASLFLACAPARPPSVEAPLDAARLDPLVVDSLVIDQVDLGSPGLDTTFLMFRITNNGHTSVDLGVDVRTIPGQWAVSSAQNQWSIPVEPHSEATARLPYRFRRLTVGAILRVRFGDAKHQDDGITVDPVKIERRYQVGVGNPAASDLRSAFDSIRTRRFDVLAYKGSFAASRMRQIAITRDRGAHRIEDLLGTRLKSRVLLVLYPDSATKTRDTGHIGEGFASGHTIIEIYNERVQLDPYHEVAHIIAGQLGNPPALFDEGFATYVSQRLGSSALLYLGYGSRSIHDAVCSLAGERRLLPLSVVLSYPDIGGDGSHPEVSYPEAASVVQYLIETMGLERFREVYRTLRRTTSANELLRNQAALSRILGVTLDEMEEAWRIWLRC